jgi:hypothetical protein
METVSVPIDLLLDSSITAYAKVIWMVLRLYRELTRPDSLKRAGIARLLPVLF